MIIHKVLPRIVFSRAMAHWLDVQPFHPSTGRSLGSIAISPLGEGKGEQKAQICAVACDQ